MSKPRISWSLGGCRRGRHQFNRALELFEVGRQLGLDGSVEHGFSPDRNCTGKRPGPLGGGIPTLIFRRREFGYRRSDLSDQIPQKEPGLRRPGSAGGADFARVGGPYWAACTLRSSSLASRPMPRSWISATLITPSGLIRKAAAQSQALFLDHHFEIAGDRPGGIADHRVEAIFLMVSEVSCQALWVKWVSVETA